MTTQITKKQHYVPQFLLRNFSYDKKRKTINVFNLDNNSFDLVDDPSIDEKLIAIKKRFQKEFFYDTDNEIENFLESKIETPTAKVIESIVYQSNLDLSSEQRTQLLRFVSSLLGRTPEALKQSNIMLNSFFNQICSEYFRFNNLDEEVTKEGKFIFDEKNLISICALYWHNNCDYSLWRR